MKVQLTLVVLKTKAIEKVKEFYEKIGLVFQPEKHAEGPFHYSANIDGVIFEIYPHKGEVLQDNLRVGFKVEDINSIVSEMNSMGSNIVSMPKQTPWGYSAIIKDPDGRVVEIYQS